MTARTTDSDKWIDYLTAYGYDMNVIYRHLVTSVQSTPNYLKNFIAEKKKLVAILPMIKGFLRGVSEYDTKEEITRRLHARITGISININMLMEKFLWFNQDDDSVFSYLESRKKLKIKVRLHRGSYEVIVFVTETMYENLKKYADVISVTYNFVPTKRNRLSRCHELMLFTGVNSNEGVIIFGVGIVVGSTPRFKAEAISHFLKLIHPIRPYCMIGSYSKEINEVMKNNNRGALSQITYLENWHYVQDRASLEYIGEPERDNISKLLKRALHTFSSEETMFIHKKINKMLTQSTNVGVLSTLLQNTMSCRCKSKPQFIGFEIQGNRLNVIADLISDHYSYARNIGELISQCFQFERKLLNLAEKERKYIKSADFFSKYPNLKIHHELHELSLRLSEDLFKKLFYHYNIALTKCSIKSETPLTLEVFENLQNSSVNDKPTQKFTYTLNFNLESNCWKCDCNMIFWSGIPCAHLLFVILRFKGSIVYYINSRWLNTIPFRNQKGKVEDKKEKFEKTEREEKIETTPEIEKNEKIKNSENLNI